MNLFQIWGRNKDSNEKKIVIVNCVCVSGFFYRKKSLTRCLDVNKKLCE
jgi:hypothetical protein